MPLLMLSWTLLRITAERKEGELDHGIHSFDPRLWTPINEGMLKKIMSYSILLQQESIGGAQLVAGLPYPLLSNGSYFTEPRFGYIFSHARSNSVKGNSVLPKGEEREEAMQALRLMHVSEADQTLNGYGRGIVATTHYLYNNHHSMRRAPAAPLNTPQHSPQIFLATGWQPQPLDVRPRV
ncbi:hypothetical protein DL765_003792 [Monosporascus sp. GIB2]|nr:hypothetical protein DL765_003792 [Monosporascus sp. GIB2]